MNEMLLSASTKLGGGVQFIEELTNAQFTTYENVSTLTGITEGTLHNEGQGWLRFDYEGTEFIVSKKTICHSISWDQINAAGCVFGTKVITINGNQYKVRLLKGADHNPTQVNPATGYFLEGSHNSEWSRLFYPLVRDDASLSVGVLDPEAPYTNMDLGMTWVNEATTPGSYSWCQETHQGAAGWRVVRGYRGVSYLSRSAAFGNNANSGWRPCLELVT